MKNLEARMQQDMVHRGQAIAAGDAAQEKQADVRVSRCQTDLLERR